MTLLARERTVQQGAAALLSRPTHGSANVGQLGAELGGRVAVQVGAADAGAEDVDDDTGLLQRDQGRQVLSDQDVHDLGRGVSVIRG